MFTKSDLDAPERFRIVEGAEYIYTGSAPTACRGHRYRVLRFAPLVPVYQQLVVVEALTGPDQGLWFCVTPANFSTRYVQADVPKDGGDGPKPAKAIGVPVARPASAPEWYVPEVA